MNKKNIISATLALSCFNWAPLIWADSCNSKAEYFTAVEPFNIDMSQAEGSSFSSALCGQDVSVTSISGEPINIASIATSIRPDGSVVYAEDVTIKVGDKEVFAGNDFTEEDLDRLLLELGAEVQSEATIAQVQQVNRQTYNTISTRLMNVISRSFIVQTDTKSTNKMAASADDITKADNDLAIWSEVSYAKIKDDNQSIQFSTDLVQVVSGLDKRSGAPCYLTKFRDSCRLNSLTYAANGRCPERPASVTTTHKSRFVITPSNGWTAIRNAILASLARYRALRISELPCRLSGTKNHHFASAPFP